METLVSGFFILVEWAMFLAGLTILTLYIYAMAYAFLIVPAWIFMLFERFTKGNKS